MCGITLFIGSDPNEDISEKRKHFQDLSKNSSSGDLIGISLIMITKLLLPTSVCQL